MRILLLGYSQIVRRRILPALVGISQICGVDIASRSSYSKIAVAGARVFDDYDVALSQSQADLVYVSTVNSSHAKWAEKALLKGFHVIVDKPAFTSFDETQKLVRISEKRRRCLAESTAYAYHPQIQIVRDLVSSARTTPLRLTAVFSFPPLEPENFRYEKILGGGALWDLGPYAVSPGRLFFGEKPQAIHCHIGSYGGKDNVETSFSVMAAYSGGKSMIGHFGFDTEYQNSISILGSTLKVEIERVFSIPANLRNRIHISRQNQRSEVEPPQGDCFAAFLLEVIDSIEKNDCEAFTRDLLDDAFVLEQLRMSAFEDKVCR